MQENEISVGAYVIALGRVRKIKTIVKKDTGVEVSFEGKNPVIVSLDMLCPIPPEILEKNGWKHELDKGEKLGEGDKLSYKISKARGLWIWLRRLLCVGFS